MLLTTDYGGVIDYFAVRTIQDCMTARIDNAQWLGL